MTKRYWCLKCQMELSKFLASNHRSIHHKVKLFDGEPPNKQEKSNGPNNIKRLFRF